MNLNDGQREEILHIATMANTLSDLTDEGRAVVVSYAEAAAKLDTTGKSTKSLSEFQLKAVSYLCKVIALRLEAGKSSDEVRRELRDIGLSNDATDRILTLATQKHESGKTTERRKSNAKIPIRLAAVAVGLWAFQFVFPTLTPAFMVLWGVIALAGLVAAVGAAVKMFAAEKPAFSVSVVCLVVSLFVVAHTLLSAMELRRVSRLSICKIRQDRTVKAVEAYKAEHDGKWPSSVREFPDYYSPYACPVTESEFTLTQTNSRFPAGTIVVDAQPCHESFWFQPLMRRFKWRDSPRDYSPNWSWDKLTTEERLGRLMNADFGTTDRGILSYYEKPNSGGWWRMLKDQE